MKRDHQSDYNAEVTTLCEQTLVTLIGDIGPWSERIYLVGGLAPRYIVGALPEGVSTHVGTTDVDLVIGLAIDHDAPETYETLQRNLDALVDGDAAVTTGEVDGSPLVILWKAGQSSALDQSDIAAGRDVGTVGVFSSALDGQPLTFRAEGDVFVDEQTGTTWNVLGDAIEGPLAGSALEPVTFVRTFWFSWAAFRPDTSLIEG